MMLVTPQSKESLVLPLSAPFPSSLRSTRALADPHSRAEHMLLNRLTLQSYTCCTPADVEEELRFVLNQGMRLEEGIKRFNLDQCKEAWEEGMKQEGKEKVVVVM